MGSGKFVRQNKWFQVFTRENTTIIIFTILRHFIEKSWVSSGWANQQIDDDNMDWLSQKIRYKEISEKRKSKVLLAETAGSVSWCFLSVRASLREDSPGQRGAGRGPAPSSSSSGSQWDEGPGPQGAVAAVLRDHWPCPSTPVTPLLIPTSPPGTADTQRGQMEPVRLQRHWSGDSLKRKSRPAEEGGRFTDPRSVPVKQLEPEAGRDQWITERWGC